MRNIEIQLDTGEVLRYIDIKTYDTIDDQILIALFDPDSTIFVSKSKIVYYTVTDIADNKLDQPESMEITDAPWMSGSVYVCPSCKKEYTKEEIPEANIMTFKCKECGQRLSNPLTFESLLRSE